MLSKLLYWSLLFLPLTVMGLPNWHTSLVEDAILLGAAVFLVLRWADDKRHPWNDTAGNIVNALFVGLIYSILWLGLVRGYYDEYDKLLALFPACLVVALLIDPYPNKEQSQTYKQLCSTFLILNVLVFIMLLFWGKITHREANPYYQTTKYLLGPSLTVLPILTLACLHAKRLPLLNTNKNHYPILFPLLAMMLIAWNGNGYTWALWYTAGKMEREWTPFHYDKTSQPEQYAAAEHKPLDAVKYYALVKQRLAAKGEIPKYWNWDFLMQYRMAYQARRLKNAAKCLAWLPPQRAKTPYQFQLVQDLWDDEFITDMMHHTDMFDSPQPFFVDLEYALGNGSALNMGIDAPLHLYTMDCFGRIYENKEGIWQIIWEPKISITNAVDFEVLYNNSFIVLTADGNVFFSDSLTRFMVYYDDRKYLQFDIPGGQKVIDMEWVGTGLIAITNYGVLLFEGNIPDTIPQDQAFNYGRPVAADLEIDPNYKGLYVLDIYGGINSHHKQEEPSIPHKPPQIDQSTLPYWLNKDVAIDLELDPSRKCLYIFNRMGELYTVSTDPVPEPVYPDTPAKFHSRALLVVDRNHFVPNSSKLYVLESNGKINKIP